MSQLGEQAESLQNLLVEVATSSGGGDNAQYRQLREAFLSDPRFEDLVPRFVRTCRDLAQFWQYIKQQYGRYQERREFLWKEFAPLIEAAEKVADHPGDRAVSDILGKVDPIHVQMAWTKALDRRSTDPEGAITMARTLLESVCKHILAEYGVTGEEQAELPKLYKATAEKLNLAPNQHTEQVFRQILGGCTAVVEGLGAMRNKLSDSHGQGPKPVKPAARHAELAVNLAGAMAAFLVATLQARREVQT